MIKNIKIRVLPQVWRDAEQLEAQICREFALSRKALRGLRMKHTSIDARQRQVMVQLDVDLYINEEPPQQTFRKVVYHELPSHAHQAVVVGSGPGGLFAALRLIELGVRPILIERGRPVSDRRRDVALITREQRVDPNSNYCFGEGGAGAFSDGKLFTRSKKRGNVQGVLEGLCQFGADTGILDASHPHIGTDKLPTIISNIRETILACGGEIHFETIVSRLILSDDKVVGVSTLDGREFLGPVILATGHSARDIYTMLHDEGILIEAKGLAIGCRLEHPQTLIDQIQYHSKEGRGQYLPPAEYSFVTQADNRGVYSFCMCPGGFVIPAATGPEQIVVNGMSPSNRGTRWSNSGMVVELRPDDVQGEGPLKMMLFQEELERVCWQQGNRKQTAPAQRMTDFVNGKLSADLPDSSYAPGLLASPLHFWLPEMITARLRQGFKKFGSMSRGFMTSNATVIGVETRTSSPVRILRDKDSLEHVNVKGLFPCGEGAGYAGGIVSAGVDGERCAEQVARLLGVS